MSFLGAFRLRDDKFLAKKGALGGQTTCRRHRP